MRERKNGKRKSTRRTSGFEWRLTWWAGGSYTKAASDPWEKEQQHREGQHSEEKEEMLRLLRRWRSAPSSVMKWADCAGEELRKQEESEELEEQREEKEQEEQLKD